jgi:hypothetical protein
MLEPGGGVFKWTQTDPQVGNRWRVLAGGARVYSFPIWLYCDDVSGNQSKRWNKHYSFLFSAAGLPRALFQHEYHVHFLCTSNLAAPLEMMDGIVSQFEYIFDSIPIRPPSMYLHVVDPTGRRGTRGSGPGTVFMRTMSL